MIYLIYIPVSSMVLSTFLCQDLGDDGSWLVRDFRVPCPRTSGSFSYGWAIFTTIVYPVGFPLAILVLLYLLRVPELARAKQEHALYESLYKLGYLKGQGLGWEDMKAVKQRWEDRWETPLFLQLEMSEVRRLVRVLIKLLEETAEEEAMLSPQDVCEGNINEVQRKVAKKVEDTVEKALEQEEQEVEGGNGVGGGQRGKEHASINVSLQQRHETRQRQTGRGSAGKERGQSCAGHGHGEGSDSERRRGREQHALETAGALQPSDQARDHPAGQDLLVKTPRRRSSRKLAGGAGDVRDERGWVSLLHVRSEVLVVRGVGADPEFDHLHPHQLLLHRYPKLAMREKNIMLS